MEFIMDIFTFLLFALLIFPLMTVLMHLLLKKREKKEYHSADGNHDFAVIVTAYKNFSVTLASIESLIRQNYPSEKYFVYVVADGCEDITEVSSDRVAVLKPEEQLNSKVLSMLFAIDRFKRKHDYIIIMDADNVAAPDYLEQMNRFTRQGYTAVQGKRTHKNLDTAYAGLDAAGEIYYNYTQRTVPYQLGSSAAISGSAMAIKTSVYENLLREISGQSGVILAEDKMLQNYLAKEDLVTAFAENALVFDEKISKGVQTQRQRTRWLKSYFDNLKTAFGIAVLGLKKRSFNQVFFGIMTAYPPIIIMILFSAVIVLLNLLFAPGGLLLIAAGWMLFVFCFLFVLLINHARKEIWKSLFSIPLFAFRQVMALLNLKKSKTDFLATEHTKSRSVDDILKEMKR